MSSTKARQQLASQDSKADQGHSLASRTRSGTRRKHVSDDDDDVNEDDENRKQSSSSSRKKQKMKRDDSHSVSEDESPLKHRRFGGLVHNNSARKLGSPLLLSSKQNKSIVINIPKSESSVKKKIFGSMAIVDAKTLKSKPHPEKKKSESESSDWEDETFLPVDEQDEYLQETYSNELPKLRMAMIMGADIRRLSLSVLKGNDSANQVNMERIVQQVIFSSSPEEIANPSRADPREFEPKVTLEKNSTRTLTRNGVVTLCVTYGFVLESYIGEGKSPQGSRQDKYFKGLDLVPLIQEHERAMGFYGMAFGEKSLRLFAPDDALQFTTFWADSNGTLSQTPTPKPKKINQKLFDNAKSRSSGKVNVAGLTHGSLQRRGLAAREHIPVWDCTEHFKENCSGSLHSFDPAAILSQKDWRDPYVDGELASGSLVAVLHTTSVYKRDTDFNSGISLNIAGVCLLALPVED